MPLEAAGRAGIRTPAGQRRRGAQFAALACAVLATACAARSVETTAPPGGTAPGEPLVGKEDLRQVASASQPGMTCRQATATARGALLRLGYEVTEARAPTPQQAGEVRAVKHTGWMTGKPGNDYHALVELRCDNRGTELIAFSDEALLGRLAMRRDFARQVAEVAARRVNRPRASSAPGAENHLEIALEPLRDGGRRVFGTDLGAAGLTPVHVLIRNGTPRTYAFAVARLRLVTQEGERHQALSLPDMRGRVGAQIGDLLAARALSDATIEPRATVEGYLFFPASTYRRADAVLIDRESEEAEGMSIEF